MNHIEFNNLSRSEKWKECKNQEGIWKCPKCGQTLYDGPKRASHYYGVSVHCDNCETELTRRTGGGQAEPFRWILFPNYNNNRCESLI